MKIAVNSLVIDHKPTGVGNYALNLINMFMKSKETSHFMDIYLQKDMAVKAQNLNSRVFIKEQNNFSGNYQRILTEQLIMPFKYYQGKYDLIHFLDYQAPFFYRNKKFIITIHDLSYFLLDGVFTKGQQFFKQTNAKWGINNSVGIITDANSTKQDLLRLFSGIDEEKIFVIPLAVAPIFNKEVTVEEIRNVKKKFKITEDYLLYTGTLEPRKNVPALLESFIQVLKQFSNGLQLVIAGKTGWMYQEVYEKLNKEELKQKVVFTGYVAQELLPALYAGAKVFVYPSIYEGFGFPPLEAMTCGTPVITSNRSSLPEVVGDGGILINPSDINELTQNILMLLNNESVRQQLISKGKKRAALYSWDKTMEETLKVYEKVGCEKI